VLDERVRAQVVEDAVELARLARLGVGQTEPTISTRCGRRLSKSSGKIFQPLGR
jgi:hypothetical protein